MWESTSFTLALVSTKASKKLHPKFFANSSHLREKLPASPCTQSQQALFELAEEPLALSLGPKVRNAKQLGICWKDETEAAL
jgi:hypothetical protein